MTVGRIQRVRVSKLLSRVLRHEPELAGVTLDAAGWTPVDELLMGLRGLGVELFPADLEQVVRGGDKQRFELSPDQTYIRARYGHSVAVEVGYPPAAPPSRLYHGTPERNVASIRAGGISPMGRRLVHLYEDIPAARQVGARRGRPVVLVVDAAGMAADGAVFHRLPGKIWLTLEVPPGHIVGVVE
ncbi:MAG: RNA 2'-phosphotransferase [Actinomycetota bacterium]|nr:RNA 2'-phosphotransferase [Actinomycetota bacterium]